MIYCILIGAFILNAFLTITMIPYRLSDVIGHLDLPPFVVMVTIMMVYLILGCFIDSAAMVTLTIPIFFPLAKSMGFHPVWFGIIVTRAMEIAMITPPVGMNVYVISGVAGEEVPMTTIFKGIMPFLFADVVHVALLFIFPAIALFLPSIMR
jgi:TRAP-type C4-dicarboxylate transport system permease large subunit